MCDNKTSADLSDDDVLRVPSHHAHADLICGIHTIKSQLPIYVITFEHIYSYQDDNILFCNLPWLAQLNVLADQQAKQELLWLIIQCNSGIALPTNEMISKVKAGTFTSMARY
jgi:hypothetical protein